MLKSNRQSDLSKVSCSSDITNYVVNELLPIILSNKNRMFQKIQNQEFLDTTKVGFKRISQVIFENGISENLPKKTIALKKIYIIYYKLCKAPVRDEICQRF